MKGYFLKLELLTSLIFSNRLFWLGICKSIYKGSISALYMKSTRSIGLTMSIRWNTWYFRIVHNDIVFLINSWGGGGGVTWVLSTKTQCKVWGPPKGGGGGRGWGLLAIAMWLLKSSKHNLYTNEMTQNGVRPVSKIVRYYLCIWTLHCMSNPTYRNFDIHNYVQHVYNILYRLWTFLDTRNVDRLCITSEIERVFRAIYLLLNNGGRQYIRMVAPTDIHIIYETFPVIILALAILLISVMLILRLLMWNYLFKYVREFFMPFICYTLRR